MCPSVKLVNLSVKLAHHWPQSDSKANPDHQASFNKLCKEQKIIHLFFNR